MLNSSAYYFKKSILYSYVSDSELPVGIIKKIFFFCQTDCKLQVICVVKVSRSRSQTHYKTKSSDLQP